MNWLRSHKRSAWICAFTVLVPVLLYLNGLFALWGVQRGYQSEIDDLIPRIARQQGLIGYENQLRDASTLADQELVSLVYPASGDRATASAALQTNVRQILSDAGLTVRNSQVLPAREKDNFDHIAIRLTVNGDLAALDGALSGIARFRPLLLVESLEIKSVRPARKDDKSQIITATLQLLSLRALL